MNPHAHIKQVPSIIQIIFNNWKVIKNRIDTAKESKFSDDSNFDNLKIVLNNIRKQAIIYPLYNGNQDNVLGESEILNTTKDNILKYMLIIINILNTYNSTINKLDKKTSKHYPGTTIFVMSNFDNRFVKILDMNDIPNIDTTSNGSIHNYNKLYNLNLLPHHNTHSNKYLKYKAKYLALKKQLNL